MLATPGFHHLHLQSVDPDAAIDFYTRQFPSTRKGSWGGYPALFSPNDVMLLFDKVDRPPTSEPPVLVATSTCRIQAWRAPPSRSPPRSLRPSQLAKPTSPCTRPILWMLTAGLGLRRRRG